jgi:hypothetical protein
MLAQLESTVVFETKEHAEEAAAYPLPPLPGVTSPTHASAPLILSSSGSS